MALPKMNYYLFVGLALCVAVAQAAGGAGLYGAKSAVIPLTKANFANNVFGSEHVWLVEFYAPWCGHCKNLVPEYEKAASNLKGIVKVGAVNCDEENDICGNFGVKGFPTIKLFPSKITEVPGKKGNFQKVPEDYQQARSAAAMANFALSKLPNFVEKVTASKEEKFLSNSVPKALLFSSKDEPSNLYKALAIDFHGRMVLGGARDTDKKLVEKYGVKEFPALIVIKGEDEPVKYEGKLSHELLYKFLEPFAGPAAKPQQASGSSEKGAKPTPAPEVETGEIYEIRSQADFDTRCVNKGGLCAIAVFDPQNADEADQTKYISTLKKVGEKWKGKFRVMHLEGPAQKDFVRELGVSEQYPTLVVFNPRKLRYTPFLGAFDEEAISEYFDSVLLGKKNYAADKMPVIADQTAAAKQEQKPTAAPAKEAEKEKDEL